MLIAFGLLLVHCTSDMVEAPDSCMLTPIYQESVRGIINSSCTFSGCHDGASGVGNYKTYQGLKRNLDNGTFRSEVLEARSMPQGSMLDATQYETLRCWAENNYAEN